MVNLILIAVGSALVSNVVLSQFLGICPFLGVSKKTETALGMGGAVIFVITIGNFCNNSTMCLLVLVTYYHVKNLSSENWKAIFCMKYIAFFSYILWIFR